MVPSPLYSYFALLSLYDNLLQRDKIYQEIRLKFREDSLLTDPAKIAVAIDMANESLGQLTQYSDLRNTSGAWKIELSKSPMPKQEGDESENSNSSTDTPLTKK